MFQRIVLLCILGGAVAHYQNSIEDVKTYAEMKVMTNCVGEDVYMNMVTKMKAAGDACRAQDLDGELDLTYFMNDLKYQNKYYGPYMMPVYYQQPWNQFNYQRPNQYGNPMYGPYYGQQYPFQRFQQQTFQQQPFQAQPYQQQPFQPQFQQQQPALPEERHSGSSSQIYQPSNFNQGLTYSPYYSKGFTKRDTTSTGMQEQFDEYEMQVRSLISNFTCIMKAMNFVDKDNQPNFAYTSTYIQNLAIDEELKAQFMEDHEFCKEFSMCMPVDKMKDPLIKEMGYPIAFHRCMNARKMKTCMAYDQRKMAQKYAVPGEEQPSFNYKTQTDYLISDNFEQDFDMEQRMKHIFKGGMFDL